ncbi:MAG: hypothetical protein GOU99_03500 [Candidatus Altiarchaeota archaeon]|nr:hypothetical protein [Candidatus Altiarchaeota archaeon]
MMARENAFGSRFLGLYLFRNKGELVFHSSLKKKGIDKIAEVLGLKPIPVEVDTLLLGVFFSGNEHGAIGSFEIPGTTVLETRYTALGNLILCNSKGAVISPVIEDHAKLVKKALCVKTAVSTIAGMETVGTLGLCNDTGCLVHPAATDAEIDVIEKILKTHVEPGKMASSGFIGSFALATNQGLAIPRGTIAPEMTHAMEVLDID